MHDKVQKAPLHFLSLSLAKALQLKYIKTKEKVYEKLHRTRVEDMEIHRTKSNKSINSPSDTESERTFHSYDSPLPSLPYNKLPPPPGYEVAIIEREQRGEINEGVEAGERIPSRDDVAVVVRKRRLTRGAMVKRAEFGCRVCEVVFCLVSLLVMVSDKTKGWAGDSYYRYIEYRYCAAVNAVGLVYSGIQACDITLGSIRGKNIVFHRLRYQFDFALDQIIAYLLISASSSGATRVDDWVSNWGEDEFTELAGVSIVMSFLAFAAFSVSSIISGYNLFI